MVTVRWGGGTAIHNPLGKTGLVCRLFRSNDFAIYVAFAELRFTEWHSSQSYIMQFVGKQAAADSKYMFISDLLGHVTWTWSI